MSFGRPPSFSDLTSAPPDRGSFPLDHYGECKDQMMVYLTCLKTNKSSSTPCRGPGKNYLECRMAKGLMERDDWRNLGMDKVAGDSSSPSSLPQMPTESSYTPAKYNALPSVPNKPPKS